jgi:hypothetical protein
MLAAADGRVYARIRNDEDAFRSLLRPWRGLGLEWQVIQQRRGVLAIVVLLCCSLAAVGAPTAEAGKLAKAKRHYKKAQAACAGENNLGQMRTIVASAKRIKKLGGKKIPQSEVYRCFHFQASFNSNITLDGKYAAPGGWNGTVNFLYHVFTGAIPLHVIDVSGHLVTLTGPNKNPSPLVSTFSGSAKWGHQSGPSASCNQISPHGVSRHGKASAAGASMSLDARAKQPRSTIYLALNITPPLEDYRFFHWTAAGCGSPQGSPGDIPDEAAFSTFFAYLHSHGNVKDVTDNQALCHSISPKTLAPGASGMGFHWQRSGKTVGTAAYSQKKSIPPPPNGSVGYTCENYPANYSSELNVKQYPVTEKTDITLLHTPPKWPPR